MKRGSECQWIQFLIYVDDRLLDELCRDFKYTRQDIERSAGEILSPTFKLKQTTGNIIFVIKTHGPGKVNFPIQQLNKLGRYLILALIEMARL